MIFRQPFAELFYRTKMDCFHGCSAPRLFLDFPALPTQTLRNPEPARRNFRCSCSFDPLIRSVHENKLPRRDCFRDRLLVPRRNLVRRAFQQALDAARKHPTRTGRGDEGRRFRVPLHHVIYSELDYRLRSRPALCLAQRHDRRARRFSWRVAVDWHRRPHHLHDQHVRNAPAQSFLDKRRLRPSRTLLDGRHPRRLDQKVRVTPARFSLVFVILRRSDNPAFRRQGSPKDLNVSRFTIPPSAAALYFITGNTIADACSPPRYTRSVAF